MMRLIVTYFIGLVFGLGIVISGMSNPAKVLNFFDIAGTWDPSLIFVMGGALVTTFIGYRLVFTRDTPVLETRFHTTRPGTLIDFRLVSGAALFGVGWGIAGLCPGGAIPALGTGRYEVFIFVASLLAGVVAVKFLTPGDAPEPKPASSGD